MTLASRASSSEVQPFLKWAGGKRALRQLILEAIGTVKGSYFEPFLGGGAIALSLSSDVTKVLGDSNQELIDTYIAVRDCPHEVISILKTFENSKEFFYEVRAWDRRPDFKERPLIERAARFIYLNKTGFNGLHRVNKSGFYNVPFGDQPKADFVMEDRLLAVSTFLRSKSESGEFTTRLQSGHFEQLFSEAGQGDVIYADPPYIPISKTADFVGYQQSGFGMKDQAHLRDLALRAISRGSRVVLSNSYCDATLDLYQSSSFTVSRISATRNIGAKTESRARVDEALIWG